MDFRDGVRGFFVYVGRGWCVVNGGFRMWENIEGCDWLLFGWGVV